MGAGGNVKGRWWIGMEAIEEEVDRFIGRFVLWVL